MVGVCCAVQSLLDRYHQYECFWSIKISNLLALVGLFLITSTNTYLAISGVFGLKTFLLMWMTGMVAMAITWTSLYYIWVHLLHLTYPMPLIGLFNFVAGFVAEVIVLYFQIPKSWRQNAGFFKTLLWLIATQLFLIVVFLIYFILGWGFYIIPRNYQWTLALGKDNQKIIDSFQFLRCKTNGFVL